MEWFRRIWYLVNRKRLEREMADEMDAHREFMARDGRQDFGSGMRLREDTREIWGWAWLDRLAQDLTYGWRVLRKSPGFALTATLILTVGIGVTLGAFNLVLHSHRPKSIPDPDTMVRLDRAAPGMRGSTMSNPMLQFYAANAHSFRSLIGEFSATALFGGAAEPVHVEFVTSNYFAEMGPQAIGGRLLTAKIDDVPGAEPVALLNRHFAPDKVGNAVYAIGRTIRLNGKPVRVVGLIDGRVRAAAVWMPLAQQPYVFEGSTLLTDWGGAVWATARLKAGVTPRAAEAETRALAAKLRESRPSNVQKDEFLSVTPFTHLEARDAGPAVVAVTLVLLVLVVACANLGNLLLARGVTREREIHTRMALGAGRWRIVRQLLTESLLLASLSGLAALILSTAAIRIFEVRVGAEESWNTILDWRVLAATVAIALLTVAVFGFAPALRLTGASPHGGRARTVFLAGQVGASCVLLMVSGLLVRSFQRLISMDPGFDYRRVAVIEPGLGSHGYKSGAALAYMNALRGRLLTIPGVERVSAMQFAPWGNVVSTEGRGGFQVMMNHVDPEFLQTLGVRLVRGRNFRPGEQNVAIVSEPLARWLWPGEDPLGRSLKLSNRGTVIGVVQNAGTFNIRAQETLGVYYPFDAGDSGAALVVRVTGKPRDYSRLFADAAKALDGRLQPNVSLLDAAYERTIDDNMMLTRIVGLIGALATLLSAIGLAGLAGYVVAQRTREFGVRIALGASNLHVVRAILSPMIRPLGIGFAAGCLGAAGISETLRRQIFGLHPLDPIAYLSAIALFTAVMALATVPSVRRAVRINPSDALRHE